MWLHTMLLAVVACFHPREQPLQIIYQYELDPPIPYAKPVWKSSLTTAEQEERLIALTVWGEARDQGEHGMHAVADVIVNRNKAALGKRFGRGFTGVVWHKAQYSCWNKGDPNREAMRHIASLPHNNPDWIKWVQAKGIAKMVMHGTLSDITGGAMYYHTGSVVPKWEKDMKLTRVIGAHRFYVLKASK